MTSLGRAKFAIKVAISHVLYYLGALQLWQAIAMRKKAVVLMYHRVLTPAERLATGSHPALIVDRDTFARQMALLRRRFVVLSIDEFADCLLRRIPFPNSSCVLTFDDGWHDNLTNALPILRQHGLPAVVFLPANFIGGRRLFWQEALTHLLLAVLKAVRDDPGRRPAFERMLRPAGLQGVLEIGDDDSRASVIGAIASQKTRGRAEVEALIASLAAELDVQVEAFAAVDGFIGWDDVAEMSRDGIAFGGHGAEHLLLTQVSSAEVESELRRSKEMMDTRFRATVPSFSYPNGYFDAAIVDRVRSVGYRLAFITRRGLVSCDDDPFLIRRLNVHEDVTGSVPMFLARVVGLL
jgi:peptidoglycan/xylan/chitin deacetylase (PgdA/CDA1 family)